MTRVIVMSIAGNIAQGSTAAASLVPASTAALLTLSFDKNLDETSVPGGGNLEVIFTRASQVIEKVSINTGDVTLYASDTRSGGSVSGGLIYSG